ncbi:FUSC family protein [Microbacterium sp.]|uniref:FUSC family protein n=1 Tax=unclassified Microbacterium TaxID=2609290 RepID=UPI00262C66C6|nr:FUSC family protein [Microbacterium sp.]
MRDVLKSLITLRPPGGPRWPHALQAAIALMAPILVAIAFGDPHIGYLAAVGSFTALYGAALLPIERVKVLPFVAVGLLGCAALGAVLGGSTASTLIGLVVVAALAAVFVFGFSLGPPGVMFFILVYGMVAHVVAVKPGTDTLPLLAAIAGGCLFAYMLSISPIVLRRHREGGRPLRELLPVPAWEERGLTLLSRTVLVAAVGAAAGIIIDPVRSYWIVAAGVVVVGISVEREQIIGRGIHRMVGTVLGAAFYLAFTFVPWIPLWVAVVLGLLQFLIELFITRNYALALILITPLVLLLTGAATGDIGSLDVALERLIDTIVGSTLGVLASFLPRVRRRAR